MPFLLFATKQDLLPALLAAEEKQPAKYVLAEPNSTGTTQEYLTAASLPSLGTADQPDGIGCRRYLVTEPHRSVQPRRIVSNDGSVWYAIDQMINPDTIEVAPGGTWQDDTLISGRIETLSDTACGQRLLRVFRAAIRKRFVRIHAYWVGREACSLLDRGLRLTASVRSPREYDLRKEP